MPSTPFLMLKGKVLTHSVYFVFFAVESSRPLMIRLMNNLYIILLHALTKRPTHVALLYSRSRQCPHQQVKSLLNRLIDWRIEQIYSVGKIIRRNWISVRARRRRVLIISFLRIGRHWPVLVIMLVSSFSNVRTRWSILNNVYKPFWIRVTAILIIGIPFVWNSLVVRRTKVPPTIIN